MVRMTVTYDGELATTLTHGPSSATLGTDAPADNMGRGLSFSPTDLLAASLVSCALTTMAIVAARHGIAFDAAAGEVVKTMTTDGPRRVAALTVALKLPAAVSPADRPRLEAAAFKCPVALSLHTDVRVEMAFEWSA